MTDNIEYVCYSCMVDGQDSLRVQKKFQPGIVGTDLEFEIHNHSSHARYPVYLSIESVQQLHAQLGNALHNYFEGDGK